jgi:hypothetical protein
MNAMIRVMLASVGALLLVQATAAADEAIGKKASIEKGEVEAGCVISTGSRILAQGSKCTALGRSYSQRDVRLTGATTAADALRLLDPAISVHR